LSTVLITGTSKGIGLATALTLARAGHTVYATMRNADRAAELAEEATQELLPIHEELSMDDFRAVMETNYFGAIRCMKAVIPHMRKRRSGLIINITSVAGRVSTSPLGPYAASKFALEALSEALAQEMKTFGVRVAIVEPGVIDTPMANGIGVPASESLYPQQKRMAAYFAAALRTPTPPSLVAEKIQSIIESGTWQLRHPVGPGAEPLLESRKATSDEDYVAFHGMADDDAWYAIMEQRTGMVLRPKD